MLPNGKGFCGFYKSIYHAFKFAYARGEPCGMHISHAARSIEWSECSGNKLPGRATHTAESIYYEISFSKPPHFDGDGVRLAECSV